MLCFSFPVLENHLNTLPPPHGLVLVSSPAVRGKAWTECHESLSFHPFPRMDRSYLIFMLGGTSRWSYFGSTLKSPA